MTRLEELQEEAKAVGLHIDTYSPGDGVTRYRFFTEPSDYFAGRGTYTALGLGEARVFVTGWSQGWHRSTQLIDENHA